MLEESGLVAGLPLLAREKKGKGRGVWLAPVCALTRSAASGVIASGERGTQTARGVPEGK